MKVLLGIALGAALIFVTLKSARARARAVPTLQPVEESGAPRSASLRDPDSKVEQSVPF
jgi:hypothetical protein